MVLTRDGIQLVNVGCTAGVVAATGVAYRQLGELFIASRMLDKAVSKGGDEMRQIIGRGFAKIGDHTAAEQWFRDDVPKINASLLS